MWSTTTEDPIVVLGGNPHMDISAGSLKLISYSGKSSQLLSTSSKPAKSSGDNISNGEGDCVSSEFRG